MTPGKNSVPVSSVPPAAAPPDGALRSGMPSSTGKPEITVQKKFSKKNRSIEALEWMIQHTVVTDYGKYCHDLTHGLYSEFYERYTGKSNAFALNYAGFLNGEYIENYQDYLLNEHRWSKENADLRQ